MNELLGDERFIIDLDISERGPAHLMHSQGLFLDYLDSYSISSSLIRGPSKPLSCLNFVSLVNRKKPRN